MNETEDNQAESDSTSFRQACRWCLYTWASLGLGLLITRIPTPLAWPVGGSLLIAGVIFSLIALFLSALGLIFPGTTNRLLFLVPIGLAGVPIGFQVWTML